MTRSLLALAGLICVLSTCSAIPLHDSQLVFDAQAPSSPDTDAKPGTLGGFNLLHHLSGISPYFDVDEVPATPPEGCVADSAAYIVRHSSIYANDEEWPVTMKPFVDRLKSYDFPDEVDNPLGFLRSWQSPITEDNLEMLTKPGAKDAEELGRTFAKLYPHLKPKGDERFLIWAAKTDRDIGTAKAFIKGALPEHDKKGNGEGDGHVELIEVPKDTPDWKASLTPHKACPRFSKQLGQPERETFKEVYLPPIVERFNEWLPGFNFTIDQVAGMQQICGYETVIRGEVSPMCGAFRDDEILAYEYGEDLRYHYMVGYGAEYSPYLGLPFLRSAVSRLLNTSIETHSLAKPSRPPNDTSTEQKLFVWFAHREEPPLIATSLGLFNNSDIFPSININDTMPSDRIPLVRAWRTSNILPFLGHIALEKITCGKQGSFVRIIVNNTPMPLTECQDGPGQSCSVKDFKAFMRAREAKYGAFEEACGLGTNHTLEAKHKST